MINISYAFSKHSPLNSFLERQIEEANLEGYSFSKWTIERNPMLVELYDLKVWHTVIFRNTFGDEISRLEGPFNSKELEEALHEAKGILANRISRSGFGLL